MSVGRVALASALAATACMTAAAVWYSSWRNGSLDLVWQADAIHATLETVIPVHNDVSFRYLLENRTDSDFRIADESDVRILGRSRSTGDLLPKLGLHVSGEFPLELPARKKTHFALVWTSDREMEPATASDVVKQLNIKSFVLVDRIHQYHIEFPVNPRH